MATAGKLQRSTWDKMLVRLTAELAHVAWRMEWDAGRFWCRHSVEAGRYLHEFDSRACREIGVNR